VISDRLLSFQEWPDLSVLLSQDAHCPQAAYSDCKCIVANNLYPPGTDGGDADQPLRDGVAALIGLPIGTLCCFGHSVIFNSVN
jgi:hypothetical protein